MKKVTKRSVVTNTTKRSIQKSSGVKKTEVIETEVSTQVRSFTRTTSQSNTLYLMGIFLRFMGLLYMFFSGLLSF